MKARDVLADTKSSNATWLPGPEDFEDALLAQTPAGEGVFIAPDGTLMRVEQTYRFVVVEPAEPLYRLVPIEEDR